jgi:uncharacterized protein
MPHRLLQKEHELILSRLQDFENIIDELPKEPNLDEIKKIFEFIDFAEDHHKKEEEILFKVLKEKGHDIPIQIFNLDHEEIRKAKEVLEEVIKDENVDLLKALLLFEGKYLIQKMREHMKREDTILYPLAKQIIEEEEWNKIKDQFDEIGYICEVPEEFKIHEMVLDEEGINNLVEKLNRLKIERVKFGFIDNKKNSFKFKFENKGFY